MLDDPPKIDDGSSGGRCSLVSVSGRSGGCSSGRSKTKRTQTHQHQTGGTSSPPAASLDLSSSNNRSSRRRSKKSSSNPSSAHSNKKSEDRPPSITSSLALGESRRQRAKGGNSNQLQKKEQPIKQQELCREQELKTCPSQTHLAHHNDNSNPNNKSASAAVVVHACDNKGRCIFHPHIQLRKKAIMGILGGWKDILRICPDCERQEIQEFVHREAKEIEKLELMLGRLDQHDVEYLNDDGVDEDGHYYISDANSSSLNQQQQQHQLGRVEITFDEEEEEECRLFGKKK